MSNEIKEEIIILLNEARNKVGKANILYEKFNEDNIYLKALLDLINNEIHDLTKGKDYDI